MNRQRISRIWLVLIVAVVVSLLAAACDAPGSTTGSATKPIVVITAPANGSQVAVGQPTAIQVVATDAQGVTRIEIKVDGALVSTVQSQTPQGQPSLTAAQDWTFAQAGSHVIAAQAFNAAGQASDPAVVTVQAVASVVVQPTPTIPPAVQPTTTIPPMPPTPTPTIQPPAKPVVKSFTANPASINAGDSATLQWEVTGATQVGIDQGVGQVNLSGSKQVSPGSTTTYLLNAWNPSGSVTKQVTVQVNPAPPASAWPVHRFGDQGAAVFAIQYLLRAGGYSLTADGKFGSQTLSAVKSFQGAKGLTADGIVGPNTWTALIQGHTVQVGRSGDAVRAVQYVLRTAHGYNITVDGIFGANTQAAVKNFQQSRGLTVDGIVGPQTWKALVTGL